MRGDGIFPQEALDLCEDGKDIHEEIEPDYEDGWRKEFLVADAEYVMKAVSLSAKHSTTRSKLKKTIRRFQIVAIPEPTVEELQAQIQSNWRCRSTSSRQERHKNSFTITCLSVCLTSTLGVLSSMLKVKHSALGVPQVVKGKGYEILAQVQAGERGIPRKAELIAELPELVIEY